MRPVNASNLGVIWKFKRKQKMKYLTMFQIKSKIFLGNMPGSPLPFLPALRRASNSFKQTFYPRNLTDSTPDEETLVQQLAALKFRDLNVQTFQADGMRAEVLRQCKNAPAGADVSIPTETAIETRAFEALCEKPAFRLYIQERNRLPNTIQHTIDCIHRLLRFRPKSLPGQVANQPSK